MTTVYMANDGKIFHSEIECENHETSLRINNFLPDDFSFLDGRGNIHKGFRNWGSSVVSEISAFCAKTSEILDFVIEEIEAYGYITDGIDNEQLGCYMWDYDEEVWVYILDEISYLESKIINHKKIMDELMGE